MEPSSACESIGLIVVSLLVAAQALDIRSRSDWDALPARSPSRISGKANYVIIHHTDHPNGCSTVAQCKRLVQGIQRDHKYRRNFSDIGYNFLIGGDGNVYEGRGFGLMGAHAPGYNSRSIGIALIGNFQNVAPSSDMLQNVKDLIALAVQRNYLAKDYVLLGHRQTKATDCPGNILYEEIRTWPHWRSI